MSKKQKLAVEPLAGSLKALEGGAVDLIIHRLRFPNYRNLESNESIVFDFPVTAILGCNGTNKSSILHALYGSIDKRSIADFWFETKMDAIPDTRDGLKQSVTHTYKSNSGTLVECIKARAPRGVEDPDYWEAVKPTSPYGFAVGAKRAPPVRADVVHLDFRAEIPAFDKYFYFPDQQHLAGLIQRAKERGKLRREYRKQDYLRRKSSQVLKAMNVGGVEFSKDELGVLSYVLGRKYEAGRIVSHSAYRGHSGQAVRFSVANIDGGYSDAFAGSGESAAAFLIHGLQEAKDGSLILLDEPETSLHPKAQQRMLEAICHFTVRKKFQVVMATHSPYFTADLPQTALRVLYVKANQRVGVSATHTAREALHEVADLLPGGVVLVEDERAKLMVIAAMGAWAPSGAPHAVHVLVRPGGVNRIYADIQAYAAAKSHQTLIVLDGDQRPSIALPTQSALPQGKSELEKIVSDFTKGPNTHGPKLNFVDAAEVNSYIEYLRKNVSFLPGVTPEALVWDDTTVIAKFGAIPDDVKNATDYKQKLELLAKVIHGLSADVIFALLLSEFLKNDSGPRTEFEQLIAKVRQA